MKLAENNLKGKKGKGPGGSCKSFSKVSGWKNKKPRALRGFQV
jgi:hypothetical protein